MEDATTDYEAHLNSRSSCVAGRRICFLFSLVALLVIALLVLHSSAAQTTSREIHLHPRASSTSLTEESLQTCLEKQAEGPDDFFWTIFYFLRDFLWHFLIDAARIAFAVVLALFFFICSPVGTRLGDLLKEQRWRKLVCVFLSLVYFWAGLELLFIYWYYGKSITVRLGWTMLAILGGILPPLCSLEMKGAAEISTYSGGSNDVPGSLVALFRVLFLVCALLALPFAVAAFIFGIFFLVFPVLAKLKWYNVSRLILTCVDVPGAGVIAFTKLNLPFYGCSILYGAYSAFRAKWKGPNQPGTLGLMSIRAEWLCFQAKFVFSDFAAFLSLVGVAPIWLSCFWFCTLCVSTALPLAVGCFKYKYSRALKIQMMGEEVPQIVACVIMPWVVLGSISEFAVYALLGSVFNLVKTCKQIHGYQDLEEDVLEEDTINMTPRLLIPST